MNHSLYFIINTLIILGPLLIILTTKKGRKYFQPYIYKYFLAIIPVFLLFTLWDIYAVSKGHWDFNHKYILGIEFAGLPMEEYLFFITVPFALLFVYHVVLLRSDRKLFININKLILVLILFFISASIFLVRGYTQTVLIAFLITLSLLFIFSYELITSKVYWLFIAIQFVLFIFVNTILTAIPIVSYGEEAILGIRIISIPLEDFIYSYCLSTICILIFNKFNSNEIKY